MILKDERQNTGASVPDQALAVPVEPVSRLDPSALDPSRDDMVYRVASAIARSNILSAEPKTGRLSDVGIDQLAEHFSTKCIPEARAAIAAMREPTEAMIDAAAATPGFKDGAFDAGSPLHQVWRAMIDAAAIAMEAATAGETEGLDGAARRDRPNAVPTQPGVK